MKNLLLTVLITFFSVACNKSQEKTTSASVKSDTLVLNNQDIVFVSPSDQTMAALKRKTVKISTPSQTMPTTIFLKHQPTWIL